MGFALARACVEVGADVILIAGGKIALPTPNGVTRINVLSAQDMLVAAQQCVDGTHPALLSLTDNRQGDGNDSYDSHEHNHTHNHEHGECDSFIILLILL